MTRDEPARDPDGQTSLSNAITHLEILSKVCTRVLRIDYEMICIECTVRIPFPLEILREGIRSSHQFANLFRISRDSAALRLHDKKCEIV